MRLQINNNINKTKITDPRKVAKIFQDILKAEEEFERDKEHFWVMGLTCARTIKYIELVSLGILTATLIHPREVFRLAIHEGVSEIIVVHNHPGETPMPSKEDQKVTEILVSAGKILGIEVLDSIVITSKKYRSILKGN